MSAARKVTPFATRDLEPLRFSVSHQIATLVQQKLPKSMQTGLIELTDAQLIEIMDIGFLDHESRDIDEWRDVDFFANPLQDTPCELVEQCWYSVMDIVDCWMDTYIKADYRFIKPANIYRLNNGLFNIFW